MRRGRLGFLAALFLAAAVADACDSDTFTGADGGEDASDDAPGVGGGDAGKTGSDAGKDVTVTTLHFCDSQDAAFFCSDFDEPDATGVWIGGFNQTGAWTAEIESTDASSKPNALEVDIVAEAGTATLNTLLGNPVDAGASSSAVIDFDMVIPPLNGPFPPVLVFAAGCVLGGPSTHYGLAYGGGSWALASEQLGPLATMTGTVPTGSWTHVKMTIGLSQTGTVALDIGNGTSTATTVSPINTVGTTSPRYPIEVEMGVFSPGVPSPTGPVYYDNVVVHVQ